MSGNRGEVGKHAILQMTADIVSAYLNKNSVHASDIPDLISLVCKGLETSSKDLFKSKEPVRDKPRSSVLKSVEHDHLICLEDGLKFKSLKRHLKTHHDMTPEEYREKWGLPADYPMLAPAYAEVRSRLAKNFRVTRRRGKLK